MKRASTNQSNENVPSRRFCNGEIKRPIADEENLLDLDPDISCLDDFDAEADEKALDIQRQMNREERIDYLMRTMRIVDHDEWGDYLKAVNSTNITVKRDRVLQEQLQRIPSPAHNSDAIKAQAQRICMQFQSIENPDANWKDVLNPIHKDRKPSPELINLLQSMETEGFTPKSKRILITENLTLDSDIPLPVYCDLKRTSKTTDLPDTLFFRYIRDNVFDGNFHPKMVEFYNESKKAENQVICDCTEEEDGVIVCSSSCPCVMVNKSLQSHQKLDFYRDEKTEISTFAPLVVRDFDHFYDTYGFNCSRFCKCHGRCNNNAIYALKKSVNKFEAFRDGPKGFGLRTRNFIPAYTPVIEFCGKLVDSETVEESESMDYAFSLKYTDDPITNIVADEIESLHFTDEFISLAKKVWKDGNAFFVDPKEYGNAARFCAHSCQPNLAPVRIFTRSFTPAHVKIVMVSTQDIFYGEELTFCYGDDYVKNLLNNNCLCRTIPCKSNPKFDIFKKANYAAYVEYLKKRFARNYRMYNLYIKNAVMKEINNAEDSYEEGSDSDESDKEEKADCKRECESYGSDENEEEEDDDDDDDDDDDEEVGNIRKYESDEHDDV